MMELKRLLTRATALLLQGAYQGAESFIEQAMAESDKIKSELAELDTLRTRVTEMAAEAERFQSVIDEANAQESVCEVEHITYDGGNTYVSELYFKDGSLDSLPDGMKLYASPIPAQQSYEQALNLLAESRENFENQFGFSSDADWVYKDLAELFISDLPAQQSPAVAVPDNCEICKRTKYAMATLRYILNLDQDSNKTPSDTVDDIINKYAAYPPIESSDVIIARAALKKLADLDVVNFATPSPLITEQDALQKLRTEVGEAINILAMCGDKTPFDQLGKKLVAAFNNSSSPKLNEAKHD